MDRVKGNSIFMFLNDTDMFNSRMDVDNISKKQALLMLHNIYHLEKSIKVVKSILNEVKKHKVE